MVTDLLAADPDEVDVQALSAIELIGAVDRAVAAADPHQAVTLYRAWIDHHPDDPLLYAINFNLGVVLSTLDDPLGASIALEATIRLNPDFLPPYVNLGMALERLGRHADAVSQWQTAVNRLGGVNAETISYKVTVLRQLGRLLSTCCLDGNAEQALRLSLEVAPHHRDILQYWLSLRQRQYKWPVTETLSSLTRAQLVAGFSPLSLAAYTDDPLLQLGVAADYARHDVGRPRRCFAGTHRRLLQRTEPHRLRIGYLSSDLREHAVGYLIAELFERHDRNAVEIFAYYCGEPANDSRHQRIKAAVETWVEVAGMTDEQAAERIVSDEIEILVDLNGYTQGARTRVLAMRPAPVIVNWLGFPGTTGSPYHNYIIADEVIIPVASETFYSEAVKRLPCYQPNDHARVAADDAGSRQQAGLPDEATVFCCFNGSHKITRFTWQRWMQILRNVECSVLWLLDITPSTNERVLGHAVADGIAPERVVFAPRLPNPGHLARYRLADLFLDTSPYGAHTTGSDALWMGLPVLTMLGQSFTSRVCGSLVSAAGLPDLLCHSSEEYVERAIELGRDRKILAEYRARLLRTRDTCVLFDTALLTSSVEQLFRDMWDEAVAGRMKRPNLTNLDIYREIGAELDRDDQEMGTVERYRDLYLAALADRHSFDTIADDERLWSGSILSALSAKNEPEPGLSPAA